MLYNVSIRTKPVTIVYYLGSHYQIQLVSQFQLSPFSITSEGSNNTSITNRINRSKKRKLMKNNNQIDLKFGKY